MRSRIEIVFRPIDRWPQEPTRDRRPAHFRVSYEKTLRLLEHELSLLGVTRAYIQADVRETEIRNDGHLRADAKPRTPRVIVAANTKFGPTMLPCDTYTDFKDNVRAIALSLEALRAVDRHGVTKRGEQYRGLKAITAGEGPINSDEAAAFLAKWGHSTASAVLSNRQTFEGAYKAAAARLHPDKGGDVVMWGHLMVAVEILRNHHDEQSAAEGVDA